MILKKFAMIFEAGVMFLVFGDRQPDSNGLLINLPIFNFISITADRTD